MRLLLSLIIFVSTFGVMATPTQEVEAKPSGCYLSVGMPRYSSDGSFLYGTATAKCSVARYTHVQVCLYSWGQLVNCNERWGTFTTNSVSTGCYWSWRPFAYVQMWGWVYWSDGTTSSAWGEAIYDRRRC